eukprot:2106196-Alexandrium_andersonii.AAC.1
MGPPPRPRAGAAEATSEIQAGALPACSRARPRRSPTTGGPEGQECRPQARVDPLTEGTVKRREGQ